MVLSVQSSEEILKKLFFEFLFQKKRFFQFYPRKIEIFKNPLMIA